MTKYFKVTSINLRPLNNINHSEEQTAFLDKIDAETFDNNSFKISSDFN